MKRSTPTTTRVKRPAPPLPLLLAVDKLFLGEEDVRRIALSLGDAMRVVTPALFGLPYGGNIEHKHIMQLVETCGGKRVKKAASTLGNAIGPAAHPAGPIDDAIVVLEADSSEAGLWTGIAVGWILRGMLDGHGGKVRDAAQG